MNTFEIGKKIRLLRLSRGMTQEQLADKLKVTPQSVSKWETGSTMPDIALLPDLSVLFGVTIDELFSMTDEAYLERISNAIQAIYKDGLLPQNEFMDYENFLIERKEHSALRGRS